MHVCVGGQRAAGLTYLEAKDSSPVLQALLCCLALPSKTTDSISALFSATDTQSVPVGSRSPPPLRAALGTLEISIQSLESPRVCVPTGALAWVRLLSKWAPAACSPGCRLS